MKFVICLLWLFFMLPLPLWQATEDDSKAWNQVLTEYLLRATLYTASYGALVFVLHLMGVC